MQIGTRDRDQDRRAQPKRGKKRLRIRLAGTRCIDHDRIPIRVDAADKLRGKIIFLQLKDFTALRDHRDISIFHLIVGNIRTMEMLANRIDNQVEQPIAIRLGKEGFRDIEQRAQGYDARSIPLALVVCQRLLHRLEQLFTFVEWLQEQTIHSLAQGTDGSFDGSETGHNQRGNIRLDHLCTRDHIEAIHFRHANIDQQEINMRLLEMFERDARVGFGYDIITGTAQDAFT